MTPRIVHVASGREWRGGQNQVRLLAGALARLDVPQVVVTGLGSRLASRLAESGVAVHAVRWDMALDPRVALAAAAESRGGPSVFHAHDAHALTLAGAAAALTGAPIVVTRRVDFPLRRRFCWNRAARIVAISRAVERVLVADGIPPGRITVVHSGIAVEEVRAVTPLGIRRQLGLPPGTPVAANVGALVAHKDQATLIAAAAAARRDLPDLHWVIAGDGPLRDFLGSEITSRGLDDHVHLIGHIPDARALIADADVFVMSSKEEGLGTSVLDALALGTPVAATRAGGIPEMLDGRAGLLVEVGDAASLARAVTSLLTDAALGERIRTAGQKAVTSWSDLRMAESMLEVYRSVSVTG
jgi:glycosyltransferase involved in cell wall biosynthesis